MKVLIIAQHSVTMVSGGPNVQARQTARGLAELGIDSEFFDPWKRYDLKQFDLAHVFGANISTYDIAARLRHFGMKFAVSSIFFTLHGPRFVRFALSAERLAARFFSGIRTDYGVTAAVCKLSDMALPNTASEARLVREGFGIPADRVRTIPNGVDERFADVDPSAFINRYGIKDFILNVGHIGSERKNVLRLIRALQDIGRPAVIIGKIHRGDYADRCIKEASENKNITIIEGLDNASEMLASAYAACDVFALPSLFETPGIAALEAALAGAKIVMTKYGGTEDYFGSRARYVDPFSVPSIRRGIVSALETRKDDELRRHVRKNFTWRTVAEKTAGAYREILSR